MTDQEWAEAQVESKAWLFHRPTGVVAQALKVYGPFQYCGDGETPGDPVSAVVLEMVGTPGRAGHAFVVGPDYERKFLALDEASRRLYGMAQQAVVLVSTEVGKMSGSLQVPFSTATELFVAALEQQVRALRASGGSAP